MSAHMPVGEFYEARHPNQRSETQKRKRQTRVKDQASALAAIERIDKNTERKTPARSERLSRIREFGIIILITTVFR
jgi:hypothetical protein